MSWFTFFCERLHISSIVWTGGGSEKDIFIIQFHGPISLALKFFTRHSTWIWFKFTVTWNSSQPLNPINLCICHDNTSVTYVKCCTYSLTLKQVVLFCFFSKFYFIFSCCSLHHRYDIFYEIGLIPCIIGQHCGFWWRGALAREH